METEETRRASPSPRPLAKNDLGGLFDIILGYPVSRVLHISNQLDVFNHLDNGPASATRVAEECRCHPRSMELLLNACVALGFLKKTGDKYENTALTTTYLVESSRATYMKSLVDMQGRLAETASKLTESIRTDKAARKRYIDPQAESYHTLQFSQASYIYAPMLPDYLDLSGRQKLFACGHVAEALAIRWVEKTPGLKAVIFSDNENRAKTIEVLITERSLSGRMVSVMGDYYRDSFGEGNDVALFVNDLQIYDNRDNHRGLRLLLTKAYESLVKGGLVVVAGYILNDAKTGPYHTTLFQANSVIMDTSILIASAEELEKIMKEVGFVEPQVKAQPPPFFFWMMTARKPEIEPSDQ